MNRDRAFTLIELLVVISIIALLSSIVLASLNAARENARMGAAKQFAGHSERVMGDEAVGIWDFDECSGSTAADRSGFGNNGALIAMETSDWLSDSPYGTGCAISFNSSGEYVDMGNASALDFDAQSFALSAWIKTTQTPASGQYAGIVGKGYLGTINGYGFYLNELGRITFQVRQGAGTNAASAVGPVVNDGLWHHVVGVRDHGSGLTHIYVDGKHAGTSAPMALTSYSNSWSFAIGARYSEWGMGYYYVGAVDEVRVYGKGLTAAEVGRLYADAADRFRLADTR